MPSAEAMPEAGVTRPRRLRLPILERRTAGRDFVWLTLRAPPDWVSLPGQFVNVLCESDLAECGAADGRVIDWPEGTWPETTGLELAREWPVARRPMSIARVRHRGGEVDLMLLVREIGRGSRFVASRPVGATLDLVGPLGTGFTPPPDDRLCVVVAGGCGLAPIFGLADYLSEARKRCVAVFGAGTRADMPVGFLDEPRPTRDHVEMTDVVEEFAESGIRTVLATDDGSAGFEGTATQALRRWLADLAPDEPLALYGCGPALMLRDLASVAEAHGFPCQVSLERWMGCGAGLCLSCVHKRRDPTSESGWTYRLTCREGPVVDTRTVVWDEGDTS